MSECAYCTIGGDWARVVRHIIQRSRSVLIIVFPYRTVGFCSCDMKQKSQKSEIRNRTFCVRIRRTRLIYPDVHDHMNFHVRLYSPPYTRTMFVSYTSCTYPPYTYDLPRCTPPHEQSCTAVQFTVHVNTAPPSSRRRTHRTFPVHFRRTRLIYPAVRHHMSNDVRLYRPPYTRARPPPPSSPCT